MLIGVLALQGGYAAHAKALEESGHTTLEVREAHQLSHIEGLVLPGGELRWRQISCTDCETWRIVFQWS